MTVWCINLKDNRDGKSLPEGKRKTKEKIEYCLTNKIIAIGWAPAETVNTSWEEYYRATEDYYANRPNDLRGFHCAANAITRMKKGDLVWFKEDVNHVHLFEIISVKPELENWKREIDVGPYRKVKEKGLWTLAELMEYSKQFSKLYARHTMEKLSEKRADIIKVTKLLLLK